MKNLFLHSFVRTQAHIFVSNFGNHFAVMLRGKGSHKLEFAYYIVRLQSLSEYTDLIQHNIFGDPKASLLRCFPFSSTLKTVDIIATRQYISCQILNNLYVRTLLKMSFYNIHIDVRDRSGGKLPFVSTGITRLVLMFRRTSNNHFYRKKSCFKTN